MSASAAPARSWSARRRSVADKIEDWFEKTDVDGLNVAFAISPGDFEDIADMLVPELTKRGRYKPEYAKGTLREKLFGDGPCAARCAASGGGVSGGEEGVGCHTSLSCPGLTGASSTPRPIEESQPSLEYWIARSVGR